MHHVTSHGATKITMDSKERDYQERLRQATAQGDGNPSVMGVQPEAQTSNVQNAPTEPPVDKTADAGLGTSMTQQAQAESRSVSNRSTGQASCYVHPGC